MKKYFLIITTFVFIISFIKCGSDSEKKDKNENQESSITKNDTSIDFTATPVELNGDESFHIGYKFSEGNSFKYKLTTVTSTDQHIVTDSTIDNKFEQKITRILKFNTVSIENDTVANLKCTITDINVYRNIDGRVVTYKSGDALDSTDLNQFVEFKGIENNPFNVKVSKQGEIIKVYNIKGITDKFVELTKPKNTITQNEISTFEQKLIKSFLEPMLSQIFREIPDKDLKIGSNWQKEMTPAKVMAFTISYRTKYNLDNIEKIKADKIALITGNADISVEGDTKMVDRGVEYNFKKPVTSAGGKIYFNINKGLLYKSDTGTKLELKFNMQMHGPKGLMKANTTRNVSNKSIAELL